MNPVLLHLRILLVFTVVGLAGRTPLLAVERDPAWKHLSTKTGELPVPTGGRQQTACLVFDVDRDGTQDIVIGERTAAPSLVWIQHTPAGWVRHTIDAAPGRPEAGGAAHDVDADGDLDLVIGGDYQSDELWWYENPQPRFEADSSWKRHTIKKGGGKAHHDQAWGDFLGTGRAQLAFWNQGATKLFLAEVPPNPREADTWPIREIWSYSQDPAGVKQEGMFAADMDADGRPDLLAGNQWLRHAGGGRFTATRIASRAGRIVAARFKPGPRPQVVLAPGDGTGPLMLYECAGDPSDPKAWTGRDLLGREVVHGHTLEVADLNADGHPDLFCAEMAKWTESRPTPDHPEARAWILYGDGKGSFRVTEFARGLDFHEARVADVNGDRRPDIVSKPYTWEAPRLDIWLNQGRQ